MPDDGWHEKCRKSVVEITAGMKNEWVRVEQKRLVCEARRSEFLDRLRQGVRRIFVLLFVATICVSVLNHRVEIQSVALSKLHQVLKKSYASNHLRQGVLDYEKQVDEIDK
jgi:hypothetical protein